ncbi:hypothetical protein BDV19DRAFT_388285 [Aspergillus venezuelensis]
MRTMEYSFNSILLGLLLPLPLIIVLLKLTTYNSNSRRFHYFTTAAERRAIIDGTYFPGGKKNQLLPYEARADIPENQAAKQAFGIQNSFTSRSETESKDFVADIQSLTHHRKIDWTGSHRAWRRTACGAVHDVIQGTRNSANVNNGGGANFNLNLTEVIQAMTLRALFTILGLSFPGDDIETKQTITLGGIIHRITIDTEHGMEYKVAFEDNHVLHSALADIFPAFGPTWRLVRRMFLELYYRYHHPESDGQDQDWEYILSEYAGQPEAKIFHLKKDEDNVSAEMLVMEALRLFTPTRHIRRVFQFEGERGHVIGAADVEACHLDPKIRGPDATEFNPDRWRGVSVMQELSFLPFGSRPFLCPVHARVGPMLVGLLVGSCWDMFKAMDMRSDDQEEVEGLKTGEGMRYYRGAYDGFYFDFIPGSGGASSVASGSS